MTDTPARVREHIRDALDQSEDPDVSFHLRQALQLLDAELEE